MVIQAGEETTEQDQKLAEHAFDEAKKNNSKSKLETGVLCGTHLISD